jgi:hypothetical protein
VRDCSTRLINEALKAHVNIVGDLSTVAGTGNHPVFDWRIAQQPEALDTASRAA